MANSKRGSFQCNLAYRLARLCPVNTEEVERMSKIPYASGIGLNSSRCALALSMYGRYEANPRDVRWTVAKTILKYL